MFLKSITGQSEIVSMLSGHSVVIGPEGREVPPAFVSAALQTGKVTMVEQGPAAVVQPAAPAGNNVELAKAAIKAALEADDSSFFTAQGLPNMNKLRGITGAEITREEAVAAMDALEAEAESKPD